jgi:hypothetical protein
VMMGAKRLHGLFDSRLIAHDVHVFDQ